MTQAIEMKERPIAFNGPMVRAILEGRKTQTRRPVKPQPEKPAGLAVVVNTYSEPDYAQVLFFRGPTVESPGIDPIVKCPYGKVGDRLYVQEALFNDDYHVRYDADKALVFEPEADPFQLQYPAQWKWTNETLPAMFMPRKYSRTLLEITGLRVERVQAISEQDAIAEGIPDNGLPAVPRFSIVWRSIYDKKPGFEWDSNPWTWVIEFKRV